MTTTTDTAGHPDVAEMSDLTEGLLPPDRSTEVRRHLDECGMCAEVYESLEEIRGLLGSAPEPGRMPDDVAASIDAVLAAESPLTAVGEPAPAHVSRETPTKPDRPTGRPRATTGPGRKRSERGRRRNRLVLGTVLTAAVLGAGTLVATSLGTGDGRTRAHGTPSPAAASFSGHSVQEQVGVLLDAKQGLPRSGDKRRLSSEGRSSAPGFTEGPSTLAQTVAPVPDCIRQALPQRNDVLGSKTGTFAGKSAYLVVVPDTDDATRVTAYVVDTACVLKHPTSPGTVLWNGSYPRP